MYKHTVVVLNVKALVDAFDQKKVLVGAFSVIVNPMDRFTALLLCSPEVVLAAGLVLGADQAGAVDTVHHQTGGRGAWAGVFRTFPTLSS